MPLAGLGYNDWVMVLPRVLAAADATGEEAESWPDPPADPTPHAARLESPSGAEKLTADPRHATRAAGLRFRAEVPVPTRSRVRLLDGGGVYVVTGVWRERDGRRWQTVCSLEGPR